MKDRCMKMTLFISVALFLLCPANVYGDKKAQYSRLAGMVHLHSTWSSGTHDLKELVDKAAQNQLEVLIPTDHDLVEIQWGLWPLRNLVKVVKKKKSLATQGPEKYLREIQRLNKAQDQVVLVPGAQASPFYYWSGNPLKKSLTVHDYRKEMLVIGMDSPQDYRGLPALHGQISKKYTARFWPRSLLFLALFCTGLWLFFRKKGKTSRRGAMAAALGLLLLVNYHPFPGSRFDSYHGPQGTAPYQDLIDYVASRDGLSFWAHPESTYSRDGVKIGSVTLQTKPYARELLQSTGYTGFCALYADTHTAELPGKEWDQALLEYVQGKRSRPVWAIAGADYHSDDQGEDFGKLQTIFWVTEKSMSGVLEALSSGRCHAIRRTVDNKLQLAEFFVLDESTGQKAGMGDDVSIGGSCVIKGMVETSESEPMDVEFLVIKNGEILVAEKKTAPFAFKVSDGETLSGRSYYRIIVKKDNGNQLVSNPIFTTRVSNEKTSH